LAPVVYVIITLVIYQYHIFLGLKDDYNYCGIGVVLTWANIIRHYNVNLPPFCGNYKGNIA
jgi:hypothetical protein